MTGLLTNAIHPGFIMILMGLIVMVLPEKVRKVAYVAAPVISFAAILRLDEKSSLIYKVSEDLKLNFIKFDGLANIFLIAFAIIAVIATIYSLKAKTAREQGMCLIYAGCNMGVILAGDCLSLIVMWELSALSSAYIVYCNHTRKSSRAAFRYLLMHAFGGGMILAGMLTYMIQNGNKLVNISSMINTPAFWIIFIGVAVNAAVPPLNSWLPDAYPESTLGGTVFLGSYTTKAAIYLMIRLFAGSEWLVWVGAFMAIYGILMALLEDDLRRLFSYHIISQLGYMVAALAMGDAWGIDGAAAHAFSNIMYKGTLLMCAGAIIYATGKRKISGLGGLGKRMPVTAGCFLVASLAISGVPFLNGFASKALVMEAVKEGGYAIAFWLLTAASVGTWLSIALKINYFAFWKKVSPEKEKSIKVGEVPLCMKVAMILGSAVCVVTGFFPNMVYQLTPNATNAHPFSLEHIFEYIILFAGATLVFKFMIKRMEPHDELSLDFDWLYRKGLNTAIQALSKTLHNAFEYCGVKSVEGVNKLNAFFENPEAALKKSNSKKVRDYVLENEEKKIGDVILFAVVALAIMIIVAVVFSRGNQ